MSIPSSRRSYHSMFLSNSPVNICSRTYFAWPSPNFIHCKRKTPSVVHDQKPSAVRPIHNHETSFRAPSRPILPDPYLMSVEKSLPKRIEAAGLEMEENIAAITANTRPHECFRVVKANKERHEGLSTVGGSHRSMERNSNVESILSCSAKGIEIHKSPEFLRLLEQ